ncbi:anion permease [Halorubrum alkaliphilum]|nr:anion permease [Halorubrum alkaliphilum]
MERSSSLSGSVNGPTDPFKSISCDADACASPPGAISVARSAPPRSRRCGSAATGSGSLPTPPLTLMATVALAASFAFVLPVATAPNAIVFGSGYLTIPEMAKVGGAVSVTGTAVIVVGVVWWLPFVWG